MDHPASFLSTRIALALEARLQLGRLAIDPAAHEARFGDVREHIQPQTLKVLISLARRRGEAVTREELIDSCWDGRFVGDDVINRSILLLRGLAKRSGGFAIETIPKSGYRLVETGQKPPSAFIPRGVVEVLLAILATAGALVLLRPIIRQGDPPTPTVAVLPFTNNGGPATRALAGSIGNSLTHMLSDSSLPVQRVASAAAARPSADFLLSGDVRQEAGSAVVTMQLGDVKSDTVLLSKSFRAPLDGSDTLPDQVGAYAAANLTWTGALMVLDRRHPSGLKITAELLKQMTITVEQGDLFRAYEISAQVAPKAPNSAIAQLALALDTGFVFDQLPRQDRASALARAREAARRARQLAPEFGDVYLPSCSLHPPLPLSFCEDELRRGLRANPEANFVSAWLRRFLSDVGRNREAINYARMSLANDPYKPGKLGGLIGRLEAVGDQAEADRLFRLATRWWPGLSVFYWERANGMAQRGDLAAVARLAAQSPANLMPIDRLTAEELAEAVRLRDPKRARGRCHILPAVARQAFFTFAGVGPGPPYFCIVALSQVGDLDSAFAVAIATYPDWRAPTAAEQEHRWLDHPVDVPTPLLASPALAAMRRDPRFLELADRVGLLPYWRSGRLPDFCRGKPEPICQALRP